MILSDFLKIKNIQFDLWDFGGGWIRNARRFSETVQHLDLTGGLLLQALGSPFAAGTQLAWDGLLPEKVGLFHFLRIRDSLEVVLLVRQEDLMKVIQKKKKKSFVSKSDTNKQAHDFSSHHGHWAAVPGWPLWSPDPTASSAAVGVGLRPPEAASETALMFQIKGS